MTPDLAARLMDLYDRATEAAVADDIQEAARLVAAAGELLSEPVPQPPEAPAARAAIAALVQACVESRQTCAAAVDAARGRLQQRAAADLRGLAAAGRYAEPGTPDARFIDRRS